MSGQPPLILCTRPEPAGGRLVAKLERLGYRAISAPMLRIERAGRLAPEPLAASDGVIFTSAAAARLAGEDLAGSEPTVPAYCVGDATAVAAREAGFVNARSAGRDAEALIGLLATEGLRRPLVIRGTDVAVDIAEALRRQGGEPTEQVIYRAVMAERLEEPARSALSDGSVDAALVFSARTAEAFIQVVEGVDLHGVTALAISARTAKALPEARFRRVISADEPTEAALIGLLNATIPAQH